MNNDVDKRLSFARVEWWPARGLAGEYASGVIRLRCYVWTGERVMIAL
jgi:hypothetical protein